MKLGSKSSLARLARTAWAKVCCVAGVSRVYEAVDAIQAA